MGSAAPAPMREPAPQRDSDRREAADYVPAGATKPVTPEPKPQPESQAPAEAASAPQPQIEKLQAAVLQALTDGNQRILVSMLESGEWSVQGNELVIKVSESQTVVDMSLGPDAKRLAIASASGVLGRAEQDPVVQRMREKFGAEIRTVIDYKEKR